MGMPNRSTHRPSIARSALVAIALIVSFTGLNAQVFEWARQGGGDGWKHGNTIAVDAAGNSIVGGEFSGSGSSAPAILFDSYLLHARGNTDAFIALHSPTGTVKWVHQIAQPAGGPAGSVTVKSIAAYSPGADNHVIYVTGEILGTVEFGTPSQSLQKQAILGSSFVARYEYSSASSKPTAVWVAIMEPAGIHLGEIESRGIAVDGSGTAYICGTKSGSVLFRNENGSGAQTPQPLTPTPLLGTSELFVAQYMSSGVAGWVKRSTTTGNGKAYGVAIAVTASNGQTFVTGEYSGAVTLGSLTLPDPGTSSNLLVARCNSNGFQWARSGVVTTNPGSFAAGHGIAIDNNQGVYVVGDFRGGLKIDQGTLGPLNNPARDFFLMKYGVTGTSEWQKQGNINLTGDARANGVAVYPATSGTADVLVTGTFAGKMTLGTFTVGSMGNHDIFVASYSPAGTSKWAQRAGNYYAANGNNTHDDKGIAVAADGAGMVYIAGEFGSSTHYPDLPDARFFDTDGLQFDHHARNVFVARLIPSGDTVTGTVRVDGYPRANQIVEVTNPGGGSDYVRTSADGTYTIWLPISRTGPYRIRAIWPPYRFPSLPGPVNPDHYVIPETTHGNLPERNFYFGSKSDTVRDLSVTVTPQGNDYAVSGSTVCYLIRYENLGTKDIVGAKVDLCYDPKLTPVQPIASQPNLGQYRVDGTCPSPMENLNWNLPSPLPATGNGSSGEILVCFDVDTVAEKTILHSVATISHPEKDNVANNNNSSTIDQDVIQPSDPNAKLVMPTGNLSVVDVRAGTALTYTVDFFNIGEGPATNVTVTDNLNLSWFGNPASDPLTTADIQPTSYSPPVPPSIHNLTGATATFTFSNASLVSYLESVLGSHGFVTFPVPVNRTLAIGTKILNRASIVFDNKPPISTNQVSTCVAPDFSVRDVCLGEATKFISFDSANGHDYLPDSTSLRRRLWEFGDGDTSSAVNPTHTYLAPGTYEARLTFRHDIPGIRRQICDKFDSVFVIRRFVVISPQPVPVVTRVNDTLFASPARSYQWYGDNTLLVGQTGARLRLDSLPGFTKYRVLASNSGGCATFSNQIPGAVGAKPAGTLSLSIHPNPGGGQFRLDLGEVVAEDVTFSVVDIRGEAIIQRSVARGTRLLEIDMSDYPAGAYTVRIDMKGSVTTRKFILQR